jgi:TRAP-type C4-dicarboxylate transport system substrate-binding protein
MNRAKFDALPADVKAAIDTMSGEVWSAKFGALWDKWDKPVREGAAGPGQEVIIPDAAVMAQWRDGLRPVTDNYIAELSKTFPNAKQAYEKLSATLRR